jgi:hypothetical protein
MRLFKFLGSMLTNDGRCACELNPGLLWQKLHLTRRGLCLRLDVKLRKKLVHCYIWSVALYGAETGTVRAVDQKNLESFNVVLEKDGEDQLDRSCEK